MDPHQPTLKKVILGQKRAEEFPTATHDHRQKWMPYISESGVEAFKKVNMRNIEEIRMYRKIFDVQTLKSLMPSTRGLVRVLHIEGHSGPSADVTVEMLCCDMKHLVDARGHFKTFGAEKKSRCAKFLTEALFFMHNIGAVHRDIKPQNIVFSKSGQAKIIDFDCVMWKKDLGDHFNRWTKLDIKQLCRVIIYLFTGEEPSSVPFEQLHYIKSMGVPQNATYAERMAHVPTILWLFDHALNNDEVPDYDGAGVKPPLSASALYHATKDIYEGMYGVDPTQRNRDGTDITDDEAPRTLHLSNCDRITDEELKSVLSGLGCTEIVRAAVWVSRGAANVVFESM
eukprot:96938_1